LLYKVNGFANVEDFWADFCSAYFMEDVKIPTLYIHSLDDPVCIKECVPMKKIIDNENCILLLTQKGGHIEFFTGLLKP